MRSRALSLLAAAALLAACVTQPAPPVDPAAVGELRPGLGLLKGYLSPQEYPSSLRLLPAPPAEGTASYEADRQAFLTTRDEPPARKAQATADANLHFAAASANFAEALGVQVDAARTPHLAMLLQRSLTDAALGTYEAKDHYKRVRPFVVFNQGSCTPQEEAFLRGDGSYPSGHSAIGWTWALIMTELAPDRSTALLARGLDFGQSRVICGVHWQSDVSAGRVIAAGVVARLHANPVFLAQLAKAKEEVAAARK